MWNLYNEGVYPKTEEFVCGMQIVPFNSSQEKQKHFWQLPPQKEHLFLLFRMNTLVREAALSEIIFAFLVNKGLLWKKKGKNLFKVNPSLEGDLCIGKKMGSHKSYLL